MNATNTIPVDYDWVEWAPDTWSEDESSDYLESEEEDDDDFDKNQEISQSDQHSDMIQSDHQMVSMDTDKPAEHTTMMMLKTAAGPAQKNTKPEQEQEQREQEEQPRQSNTLFSMFRRIVTPPASPITNASSFQPRLFANYEPVPVVVTPKCDPELIVKRPIIICESKPNIVEAPDQDTIDTDLNRGVGWKSALLAVILALVVSLLFITFSVPIDGSGLDNSSNMKQVEPVNYGNDGMRTVYQILAVLSACREIRVARQVAVDMVSQLPTPVVMLVEGIIEAFRSLVLLFFSFSWWVDYLWILSSW